MHNKCSSSVQKWAGYLSLKPDTTKMGRQFCNRDALIAVFRAQFNSPDEYHLCHVFPGIFPLHLLMFLGLEVSCETLFTTKKNLARLESANLIHHLRETEFIPSSHQSEERQKQAVLFSLNTQLWSERQDTASTHLQYSNLTESLVARTSALRSVVGEVRDDVPLLLVTWNGNGNWPGGSGGFHDAHCGWFVVGHPGGRRSGNRLALFTYTNVRGVVTVTGTLILGAFKYCRHSTWKWWGIIFVNGSFETKRFFSNHWRAGQQWGYLLLVFCVDRSWGVTAAELWFGGFDPISTSVGCVLLSTRCACSASLWNTSNTPSNHSNGHQRNNTPL